MLKPITALCALVLSTVWLAGCSSFPGSQADNNEPARAFIIPIPHQPSAESQFAIQRLSEILAVVDMSKAQRARLYYNRGRYYDSVGLDGLAAQDFQHALQLKPDSPDIYNFLGIQQTQAQEFIEAYDNFEAALELDPEHDYARLNRAIALYYGHRPKMALKDIEIFHERAPQDPYRVLWMYLIERDINPDQAAARLAVNRTQLDPEQWADALADLYLGKINEEQVIRQLTKSVKSEGELSERMCEAYFYFAKRRLWLGQKEEANMYFRLALASNVYDFVEHRYASLELRLMVERRDRPSTQLPQEADDKS